MEQGSGRDRCQQGQPGHLHAVGEDASVLRTTATSWRALGTWLRGLEVNRVVMEATGRYHRKVHQCLHDRGFEVVLVNPLRARRFAEATGHLAKTDRVDALMLARLGTMLGDLEPVAPQEAFLNRLEDLLVARATNMSMRGSC